VVIDPSVSVAIAFLQAVVGRVGMMLVIDIQDGAVDQPVGQVPGVIEHPGVVLGEDRGQGRGGPRGAADAGVALADAQVDKPALALGGEVQDLPGMVRAKELKAMMLGQVLIVDVFAPLLQNFGMAI
jgi:hypothetical protein